MFHVKREQILLISLSQTCGQSLDETPKGLKLPKINIVNSRSRTIRLQAPNLGSLYHLEILTTLLTLSIKLNGRKWDAGSC
jgi:hypothetical protein